MGGLLARWAAVGLGAVLLAYAPSLRAEPLEAPKARVATASLSPAEQSQEALMRELAQPPFLPPEVFTDLQYAVPAPIIGGLGVEVE